MQIAGTEGKEKVTDLDSVCPEEMKALQAALDVISSQLPKGSFFNTAMYLTMRATVSKDNPINPEAVVPLQRIEEALQNIIRAYLKTTGYSLSVQPISLAQVVWYRTAIN
jgi:hypothetical protein